MKELFCLVPTNARIPKYIQENYSSLTIYEDGMKIIVFKRKGDVLFSFDDYVGALYYIGKRETEEVVSNICYIREIEAKISIPNLCEDMKCHIMAKCFINNSTLIPPLEASFMISIWNKNVPFCLLLFCDSRTQ